MAQSATINLLPKQTEAWDAYESKEITELGYGGAAGGGKTRLGWYLAIHIAESYPGSRGAVARKELKNLRLTTLTELFAIFNELGYRKDVDFKYNEKDSIIKFLSNGSEILLLDTSRDTEDPEYTKFGSLPLTWAWIEESNESPEKAINILKTRVGRNNKFVVDGKNVIAKPFWLETFNPNKGYVYRTYYKPWKEKKLPPYRAFIAALPGDNPHLLPIYLENLRRADAVTRERLLNGNFDYDADPMKIMAYEAITDLPTNTLPAALYGEPYKKYLINDIARDGGDKIVLAEFEGLALIGLGVYTHQGIDTTEKYIKDQATESKIPFSQVLSDEGGIGGGVIDHLKGTKGFIGNGRPLTIKDEFTQKDIAENFSNLRSQCYFKLADYVNDHLMAINLRYFNTNIEGYTKEDALSDIEDELDAIKRVPPTGSQHEKQAIIAKSDIKEALGRSPDYADVFMMRMMFEFKPPPDRTRGKVIVQSRKVVINRAY